MGFVVRGAFLVVVGYRVLVFWSTPGVYIYYYIGCANGALQVFHGVEEVIVGLPSRDAVW